MKTRTDLITATLTLLQADGGAGQSPEAEDVAQIEAIIDGKLDELAAREILYVDDREEFADAVIDPLSVILANTAAPRYGQARDEGRRLAAEATLLSMKPSTYVPGSTLAVDYF